MKPGLIALGIVAALAAATARAQSVEQLLQRNAAEQARIARDIARGTIGAHDAALLEDRAAGVYRLESQALAAPNPDAATRRHVRQAQSNLAGAIAWAERHRPAHAGSALDRMHLRVAAARDAEQQRWIAHEFRQGQLVPAQLRGLEAAQAQIAQAEFGAARNGHETLASAEAVQHMQNVQDYAIRKDPSLALPDAQRT